MVANLETATQSQMECLKRLTQVVKGGGLNCTALDDVADSVVRTLNEVGSTD